MKKRDLKALQDFAEGKDFESNLLRELIKKQLTDSSRLQKELDEQRERNAKLAKNNNSLHELLLENMNEKALLVNEKNYFIEQAKYQTIGAREQRLINVAKSLIIELEQGSINEHDQQDIDLRRSEDLLESIRVPAPLSKESE